MIFNFAIIAVSMTFDIYWKYKKHKHDKAWVKHNQKKNQNEKNVI